MRAMMRWTAVLVACSVVACATGEEAESVPPIRRSDAGATTDTAPLADSSVPEDSGGSTADTAAPTLDTAAAMDTTVEPDTSPIDTGTPDTGTPDTGTLDTGTVMMDTAPPPTCAPSGEYGGTCKTNLDCAAIAGCGYVCCAYDPSGTFSIGCGRTALGGLCIP